MEYKDFNEASKSGKTFYQVMFYDRREDYSGFRESVNFKTEQAADETIAKMKKVNEELFQEMLALYKEHGITEENYRDCDVWNWLIKKIDWDNIDKRKKRLFRFDKNAVGFCFIDKYERNTKREEREEQEKYENMTLEEKREEALSQGPYGGAFADWDDYHRWKEG